MQRPEKETIKGIRQAAKAPSARTLTARCSSPKLGEGEGALPQKILRFSGDPSVGLEGRGVGAVQTADPAALEPVSTASLSCSPPIPAFPPIREKGGGHG